ncbi:glycerate kinase [Sulfuricella denitrificans skB26]|uniref:Glycerate kinase n=1 Tax=Sulfuricella denitrificans (strain DSM 22764 / NBRC 105220 / skB26) TaxID=1163617 RepID=S6AAZ4_SULDS|nr:glycerate kinase [Sulfuricella denitrificans]BAN34173.1 glycerate kinase [Sulfuricella denitrificans skB26]
MVVVIAPDSFKGSLSALAAAQAMAQGVRRVWPEAVIRLLPMADGGEGTLDAVLAGCGGRRLEAEVTGAHGYPLQAAYALLAAGTAVIEVAQVVGLTLPGVREVAVAERSTRGVGELIRLCLDQGVHRLWIGLGGSATNDGGVGMLAALGARFLDRSGAPIEPTLHGLADFHRADFSGLDSRLADCELHLLTDVINPLCGEHGATAVFGPQKDVLSAEIARFDERLHRFSAAGDRWLGSFLSSQPGSGAAGGLGYALQLLGGRYYSGAETVCQLLGLDAALEGADWVVTGEGRSDSQTHQGKAPWVVAQHAHRQGVPVSLVSGCIAEAAKAQLSVRFDGCFVLAGEDIGVELAMREATSLLVDRVEEAGKAKKKSLQSIPD